MENFGKVRGLHLAIVLKSNSPNTQTHKVCTSTQGSQSDSCRCHSSVGGWIYLNEPLLMLSELAPGL